MEVFDNDVLLPFIADISASGGSLASTTRKRQELSTAVDWAIFCFQTRRRCLSQQS